MNSKLDGFSARKDKSQASIDLLKEQAGDIQEHLNNLREEVAKGKELRAKEASDFKEDLEKSDQIQDQLSKAVSALETFFGSHGNTDEETGKMVVGMIEKILQESN